MDTTALTQPKPERGPFDRYSLAVSSTLSAIVLWEARLPGFYYLLFIFFLTFLWMGVLGFISLRMLFALAVRRQTEQPQLLRGWRSVLLVPTLATALVAFKLPLHLGFAFAQPTLDHVIESDLQPGDPLAISRASAGPYTIFQQARRRCHDKDRIYFTLSNDSEAGFVYSPSGIEDLCYNSGSKGHLSGNWYWMAED